MISSAVVATMLGSALAAAQETPNAAMSSLISVLLDKPTETALAQPTSFTGDSSADAAHQTQISAIYCPDRSCSSYRDWLTQPPNGAANWVLGTVCLLIALVTYRIQAGKGRGFRMCLPPSGAAAALLFISLFLRAALSLDSGNKQSIYVASLVFNYLAGVAACSTLHVNALAMVTLFQPPTTVERVVSAAVRNVLFWCPTVLFIVGVVFSSGLKPSYSEAAGMHCIQAALVFIICAVLGVLALVCWRLKAVTQAVPRSSIVSAAVFFVFLPLWAAYMLARSFMSLDAAARSSQVVYGLLNHAALILCVLAGAVFGQPMETGGTLLIDHRRAAAVAGPEGEEEQHIETDSDAESMNTAESSHEITVEPEPKPQQTAAA
ncbi:hypothetical protein IWW55_005576 [Coemansia sp. RSA 2706]|nr:hypothetical protein IWW55_005576 [Coemansia sp. RSA 2706]